MAESSPRAEQLTDKAFHALIEFARLSHAGPLTPRETAMLQFTLAFLYRGGDRADFDLFFHEARLDGGPSNSREAGRFQALRGALARILRRHGRDYW